MINRLPPQPCLYFWEFYVIFLSKLQVVGLAWVRDPLKSPNSLGSILNTLLDTSMTHVNRMPWFNGFSTMALASSNWPAFGLQASSLYCPLFILFYFWWSVWCSLPSHDYLLFSCFFNAILFSACILRTCWGNPLIGHACNHQQSAFQNLLWGLFKLLEAVYFKTGPS